MTAVAAIGVGMLMISGEFDISIAGTFTLVPFIIAITFATFGWPLPFALLAGLAVAMPSVSQRLHHRPPRHPVLHRHARDDVRAPRRHPLRLDQPQDQPARQHRLLPARGVPIGTRRAISSARSTRRSSGWWSLRSSATSSSTAIASATMSSPPAATATRQSRSASRSTRVKYHRLRRSVRSPPGFAGLLQGPGSTRSSRPSPPERLRTEGDRRGRGRRRQPVRRTRRDPRHGARRGAPRHRRQPARAPQCARRLFKGFLGAIIILAVVLNTFLGRRSRR